MTEMIISNQVHAVTGAYASQQSRAHAPRKTEDTAANAGEFVLSQTGQNFSSLLRQLKNHSDEVRMDRVAALEKQVASGEYRVDEDAVAASLMAMRY